MKLIFQTLLFIFLFFAFKEITYLCFDWVELNKNQVYLGQPADMLKMQFAVLGFAVFLTFIFYFLDNLYQNHFKNQFLRKSIIFMILVFFQIIILSSVHYLKLYDKAYIHPKTFLFSIIMSTVIISILIMIAVFLFKNRKSVST